MKNVRLSDYCIARFIKASIDMILYVKGNSFNPEPLLPEKVVSALHKAGYGYKDDEWYINDEGNWCICGGKFYMPSTKAVIDGVLKCTGGNHRPVLALTEREYAILRRRVTIDGGVPKRRHRQIAKLWKEVRNHN